MKKFHYVKRYFNIDLKNIIRERKVKRKKWNIFTPFKFCNIEWLFVELGLYDRLKTGILVFRKIRLDFN